MDATDRVFGILIVGTLLMYALEPDESPPVQELVRVEMSRVLTLPRLQTAFPSYKDVLDPFLAREIMCQPWEASTTTGDVVRTLVSRMIGSSEFPVDRFLDEIEYQAIRTDPVVYALLRRGTVPRMDDDEVRRVVEECCSDLGCSYDDVSASVLDMYGQIWTQLS